MKLFKKLFSVLVLCICCAVLAAVAGCNTLSEGDGWIEVQSITYTTDSGTTTLTSTYRFNVTTEDIEQTEYDSAPEGYRYTKHYGDTLDWFTINTINIDKSEFESDIEKVGKSYYYRYTQQKYIGEPYAGEGGPESSDYMLWYLEVMSNPDNFTEETVGYNKVSVNSYSTTYIRLRFTNDKGIEFYEDGNTITKVYPITYTVTYFKN